MNRLTEQITNFLNSDKDNVLSVATVEKKLQKKFGGNDKRFSFTLSDIEKEYGSVADLLRSLPAQGFTEKVVISLRKVYGNAGRYTYRKFKDITVNITPKKNPQQNMMQQEHIQQQTQPTQPTQGLGYAQVAHDEWLQTKVKESRYNEIERELRKLQDELSDTRSKLRIKEEEYATLKIKLETEQERSELKLERDRLDRKGFMETPAFEKIVEGLGAVLPSFLAKQQGGVQALGMPDTSNLSATKQQLVQYLQMEDCTEDQARFLAHVLNNYNETLVQTVMDMVNNKSDE